MPRFAKQAVLASYPADLDGYVDDFGEPQGERLERRQLRGGVSGVYHGQAQRLCKQRVVVVDVTCHVSVCSGGGRLGDEGTARSPEDGDGLDPPSLVRDEA